MPWFDRFDALFAPSFPDCQVLREEPMDRHTTFRIGGPARRFVRPAGAAQCGTAWRAPADALFAPVPD